MSEVLSSYFRIDWNDFRDFLKSAILNRETPGMNRASNRRQTLAHLEGSSWAGFTQNQLKDWIQNGFKSDSIQGLEDLSPPIREKRKLRFSDEGDELNIDLVLSGSDNYYSTWSKRESIPGVSIEAGIMFSGSVDARTVAQYSSWLCGLAYSLESAGVDTEITLDFPSWQLDEKRPKRLFHNVVRVKKQNETTDFFSWSPMLSPAALRGFGFTLGYLHADRDNFDCSGSFGRGVPERGRMENRV